MNNPRVVRSRGGHRARSQRESTGRKKWIVLAALFLLLSSLGAWAMLPRTDPQLEKVKEIQAQLESAPREQRRELWGQMREEMQKLPEEAREQLFADRRQAWEARENKMLDDFFSKSKAEQIAELDKQIDEEVQRDAERARRRAQESQANRGDDGGRGRGGGWRDGGGRNGGGRDPAARLERSKRWLDRTTPDQRAQRAEYRRMRDERRKQRGINT